MPGEGGSKSRHPVHRGFGVPCLRHLLLQQLPRQRRGLAQPRARPSLLDGVAWVLDHVLDQSRVPQMVSLECGIRMPHRNMQRLCVTCSVRVKPASSPRVAISASTLGTARTIPEVSNPTPSSPHHVQYVWRLILPYKLYTGTGTSRSLDCRSFLVR